MEGIINWIEQWYASQCDGEWEHEYGIKIYTLDNPGWSINIDLKYTKLEDMEIEYQLFENAENDWYGYSIKNAMFKGGDDPGKLEFLLYNRTAGTKTS